VAFAERLRKAIETMDIAADDRTLNITASIGVAAYDPESKMTATELIDVADKALYDAKNSGRNRVVAADHWISDDGFQRIAI
jgi:diguanylate cyclase (GGDEF)-like protein